MSKGESTRQRIIEQAAPLFNQRGFEGCSIQDVMEATGLEKGCIYRHFTNKEELAAAAFRYAADRAIQRRMDSRSETGSATERLRLLIHRFVHVPSTLPGGCPLMNTAIDADDGNPVLRQLAREGLQQWKSALIHVVEQGLESGEIRVGTDPRRVANTIIATLEGALMLSRIESDRAPLLDAQATLDEMLFQLVPAR